MKIIVLRFDNIRYVIFATILFIYIFNPPLLPINMHIMIEVISLIYIILILGKNKGNFLIDKKAIRKAMVFLPFIIYVAIITIVNVINTDGSTSAYTNSFGLVVRIFLRLLIVCMAFYLFAYNNKMSFDVFTNIYIGVAIAQLVFVLICIVFPAVRTSIINMIIRNSSNTNIVNVVRQLSSRRGYGLAENLFDSFGYNLSFLISIVYLKWLKKVEIKNIILVGMLLVACVMNARTGVLLAIIIIIVETLVYKKSYKQIKYILLIMIMIPFALFLMQIILQAISPNTLEWIQDGYKEIITLFRYGEYVGTFDALRNDIFWPSNIMFGAGGSPEDLYGQNSDVGYVQCVWRYGIVGTILLIGGYFFSLFNSYKGLRKNEERTLTTTIFLVFIIYLFKIYSINNLGGNFMIFSISISLLLKNRSGISTVEK